MPEKTYSFSKAVRELLNGGVLTGIEREAHYMLQREAESGGEHAWLHGGNPRDHPLFVPLEMFLTRQLTTSTFPIGV